MSSTYEFDCVSVAPSGQSTPEPRNEKEAVEGLELKGNLEGVLNSVESS